MTEKTVYIAFDGKEFEDHNECERYESKELQNKYGKDLLVYDENGELIWECPNCKNRDHSKMNVARRTCGYIGSNFWNDGRTDEIAHRFVHLDNHEIK